MLSRARIFVTAMAVGLATGGCALGPKLEVPITQNFSEPYTIQWVHAYRGKQGVEIWGKVRRGNYGHTHGHIHLEALTKSGEIIAKTDTYLPKMISHPFVGKSFYGELNVNDVTEVSRLLVEIRINPDP
ncbi:hypothetical protein DFR51_3729 [Sphingosinicella microcystinivorans]|jgi:hypothetical protein|uniref:YceI-like domain-containing protein n=2 Tax=Sphingosinicella microcystinivorans TaxID=335406 RepID=A0ABX9SU92_SPHMI|nr:hypothetical protein DFR51_3729 [Sphingosinicella microcystinivorans]